MRIGSVFCQNLEAIGQTVLIWARIQFYVHRFRHFSFAQLIQVKLYHLCKQTIVIQVDLDQLSTNIVRCTDVHNRSK